MESDSSTTKHEAAVKELEGHLLKTRRGLESVENEKSELEAKVQTMSVAMVKVEGTIQGHELKISQLESELQSQQKEMELLGGENADVESKLEEITQDNDQLNRDHEKLEIECAELKLEIAALKRKLIDHSVSAKDELDTAESEKGTLQTVVDDARHTIESLQEMLSVGEERIKEVCSANEALLLDQEEAYKEVEAAQQSISVMEHRLHQAQDQLKHANSEKNSLEVEHTKSLQHLETVVENLNSDQAQLVAKMKSINKELAESLDGHRELEQRNSDLSLELLGHTEKLSTIETEKSDLKEQLSAALTDSVNKDIVNGALQAEVSNKIEIIASMAEKVASAEKHIEQMRTDNESIIAEQEEAYKELEARLGELFKGLELLKSEKGGLQARIAETESIKNKLSDECQELEKKNAKLQSELQQQQEQFALLEEEKTENEDLLSMATNDLTTNDAAILEAQQTIVSLQKHLAAAEERAKQIVSDKASALSDLEQRLAGSHQQVESLQSGRYDLETRIEELESGLDCQLQELQEKIMNIESENEDLKNQVEGSVVAAVESRSEVMEIKSATTAILAEKDALEAILSESQLRAHQLEDELDNARSEKEKILTNTALHLDEKQKKLEALTRAKSKLETELSLHGESDEALKRMEKELQHELLLKENLDKRLQERALEREEATAELEKQTAKNRVLSRSLADCLPKEKETELLSEIGGLQTQNTELKQLLISANESEERSRNTASALESKCNNKARELDDALYRLSQLEEELRLSELPQGNAMDRSHSELMDELETIAEERAELQDLLEKERKERGNSEDELKRRMGEEQRLLIHEAETRMNELRVKAEQLEDSLEQCESEGYQARQEAEELRDQNKEMESSCVTLEENVSKLRSSIERQETQISVLHSELKKAKAESYASKESAIEMKDKMRKASRESEKVARETQATLSEVSTLKRKISNLERDAVDRREECDRLKTKLRSVEQRGDRKESMANDAFKQAQEELKLKDDHIETLNLAVAKLEGESKNLALELRMAKGRASSEGGKEDSNRLKKTLDRLTTQMKQKDSRIKKLEAVRLTKEQVESIKKLKVRTYINLFVFPEHSFVANGYPPFHRLITLDLKRSVQVLHTRTQN